MNNELKKWITTAQQASLSETDIISRLKAQGWLLNDINAALHEIKWTQLSGAKHPIVISWPAEPFKGYGIRTLAYGIFYLIVFFVLSAIHYGFGPTSPLNLFTDWIGLFILFFILFLPLLMNAISSLLPWFQKSRYHRTYTFTDSYIEINFHGEKKTQRTSLDSLKYYKITYPKILDRLMININQLQSVAYIRLYAHRKATTVISNTEDPGLFGMNIKLLLEIPLLQEKEVRAFLDSKNIFEKNIAE